MMRLRRGSHRLRGIVGVPGRCVGCGPRLSRDDLGRTMPLTPADIHNTAFKKPPIGKRGYDEEEVDAFLDEVEQELIRLLEENGALHDQMRRGGGGGAGAALSSELAELMAQLERMQEARARA